MCPIHIKHIASFLSVNLHPLVDRQRREYFAAVRDLDELAARQDNDDIGKLLIGGASLYIQALLKWMDLWEEQFSNGARDKGDHT